MLMLSNLLSKDSLMDWIKKQDPGMNNLINPARI
jgi:hypothetical protein